MATPKPIPGSAGDVAGYILYQMGLGFTSSEALSQAQINFFDTVNPVNIQAGFNAALQSASAAGLIMAESASASDQANFIPFLEGALPGYNYQVSVTLTNDETGDTEEREIRLNSTRPLDLSEICGEAFDQVEEYISDSDQWQGFTAAMTPNSPTGDFGCTVTAAYQG